MLDFFIACGRAASAATGDGCYNWPVIKQIIWAFGYAIKYLYKFLDILDGKANGNVNIGLVIILFTIIVKFILLPMTIKQQKFTKMQQIMQPELTAIQEKYKGRQGDQYAAAAMQEETKAVYAKYGVSQTGGCLQSFIQLPIIIALYGALRKIPLLIDEVRAPLQKVIDTIGTGSQEVLAKVNGVSAALVSSSTVDGVTTYTAVSGDTPISMLYTLAQKGWDSIVEAFGGPTSALGGQAITEAHEKFVGMNSFLGWDISQTPWNLMKTGTFIGILALLIPLLSGFSQWLSFKLTQTASAKANAAANAATGMGASNRMMEFMMPLMSVYFGCVLSTSLGIYWVTSSVFQVVLQIFINKSFRKMDMDEFVAKSKAKAEAKAKKKRERNGVAGSTISSAANTSTKGLSVEQQAAQAQPRSTSIRDIANMNVSGYSVNKTAAPNSLAAKAGMVQTYNEDHKDSSDSASARKSYKK